MVGMRSVMIRCTGMSNARGFLDQLSMQMKTRDANFAEWRRKLAGCKLGLVRLLDGGLQGSSG